MKQLNPQATDSEHVLCNERKPACSNKDPAQPNNNNKLKKTKKIELATVRAIACPNFPGTVLV